MASNWFLCGYKRQRDRDASNCLGTRPFLNPPFSWAACTFGRVGYTQLPPPYSLLSGVEAGEPADRKHLNGVHFNQGGEGGKLPSSMDDIVHVSNHQCKHSELIKELHVFQGCSLYIGGSFNWKWQCTLNCNIARYVSSGMSWYNSCKLWSVLMSYIQLSCMHNCLGNTFNCVTIYWCRIVWWYTFLIHTYTVTMHQCIAGDVCYSNVAS